MTDLTPLQHIIHQQIKRFGPISVADYMTLCLLQPEHGYYTTQTALGAQGDFTTAPEISQMFGEMLGLCLVQCWQDQGRPDPFALVELGPGRGTLMADILRVEAKAPGFLEAAQIWLIEASPRMQQVQSDTLADHTPSWVAQVTDLPDLPLFLVANEFFDALPVRQFRRAKDGWQEQMIGLSDGQLVFGLAAPMQVETFEDRTNVKTGDIVETNSVAQAIIGEIAQRIADKGGAALVVDYGDWAAVGDTFQAVRQHRKTDPLAEPGKADLTAHVDFAALARAANDVSRTAMTAQGVLLERLGITPRAQALAGHLSGAALDNHVSAHRRLTHPDEMGTLFKAIALYQKGAPPPPGFDLYDP